MAKLAVIGNLSVKALGLWRTVVRFESTGVASHAGALNTPVGGFVSPVGGFVLLVVQAESGFKSEMYSVRAQTLHRNSTFSPAGIGCESGLKSEM